MSDPQKPISVTERLAARARRADQRPAAPRAIIEAEKYAKILPPSNRTRPARDPLSGAIVHHTADPALRGGRI